MPVKRIFIDLDGVLVDFVSGACRLFGLDSKSINPGTWKFNDQFGIPDEDFFAPMGFEFWMGLQPTPDGKSILLAASELARRCGAEIALLSSPVHTPGCGEGKRLWVKEWYGDLWAKRLVLASSKPLVAYGDQSLLIDDSDSNINDWRSAGGRGILVARRWNSLHAVANTEPQLTIRSLDQVM